MKISTLRVLLICLGWSGSLALDCDFEGPCLWRWQEGFVLVSAQNVSNRVPGDDPPTDDADKNIQGHFLYYGIPRNSKEGRAEIVSPWFEAGTKDTCAVEVYVHMSNMKTTTFKVILKTSNLTWEAGNFMGNDRRMWDKKRQLVGHITQPFLLMLEVYSPPISSPGHVAIDNIKVVDCIEKQPWDTACDKSQFQCSNDVCIDKSQICDFAKDCVDGEDEELECDRVPESGRCTFENSTCGWTSTEKEGSRWIRHNGSTPSGKTGPSFDHTYKNSSGIYMLASFVLGHSVFGHQINLHSDTFNPPPLYHQNVHSEYYNACQIRFYYHKYGNHVGDLQLNCIELDPRFPDGKVTELWRSFGSKGDVWRRAVVSLPALNHKFYLQFSATRGLRHTDIAIDDVTLSPECFGIGVPENETKWPSPTETMMGIAEHPSSASMPKKYTITTCGNKGSAGPTATQCTLAYKSTNTKVKVFSNHTFAGIQVWEVPESAVYTLFIRGAGGGNGQSNRGASRGAFVRATFNWTAGENIYILVGQQGTDACSDDTPPFQRAKCNSNLNKRTRRDMNEIRNMRRRGDGGGGGGGGATYIFTVDPRTQEKIPLLIAGGGGGMSINKNDDSMTLINPDGQRVNSSAMPGNGWTSLEGPGGGGGWNDTTGPQSAGRSLIEGGQGGAPCSKGIIWMTFGGFGGGGGSCAAGGGGGGFRGGDAVDPDNPKSNGKGGTSYVSTLAKSVLVEAAKNVGHGKVEIVPAQKGCGCEYLCVILDLQEQEFHCLCPLGEIIKDDGTHCAADPSMKPIGGYHLPARHIVVIIMCILVTVAALLFFFILGFNRYRKKHPRDMSHEPLNNPELQLSRLRQGGTIEYNPNYEFGGSTCTIQDLREIPRENLTLVKALGQGAFGEVYQGYATLTSNNEQMPVAVKTLPELSSSQAEMDFLMEALIVSKFNHPNIVGFIGVCFEKLPRFIVLELLPGGDLKSFLRESRPKPHKSSPLTLTDLLNLALDVAKGCHYLEDNHFIHRDIAARNCLLTTKAIGRVVKIADFGMARDIYRADYYRKGGKAMLPVKWMPPEAFLDGLFTSKTDVWSFGVLLWEVLSLGYMPYPGRGNQEVMQLVTSGGRLEPPTNCPNPVYHIMMQCWHPIPDDRPTFSTIIERLGYCLQVQRPDKDLLSPGSEDYLIPMPPSTYSLATEKTDLQSSPSLGSVDQLLELEDKNGVPPSSREPLTWETNFMQSESQLVNSGNPWSASAGYSQVSTKEDVPSKSQNANKPATVKHPNHQSLESLPVAPEIIPNANDISKVAQGQQQSSLPLDAMALQRQVNNNPVRYINVDVNCNNGDSPLSLTRTNSCDQNTANQNIPYTGTGINPVA